MTDDYIQTMAARMAKLFRDGDEEAIDALLDEIESQHGPDTVAAVIMASEPT
jgi:hypothetical protein